MRQLAHRNTVPLARPIRRPAPYHGHRPPVVFVPIAVPFHAPPPGQPRPHSHIMDMHFATDDDFSIDDHYKKCFK